MNILLKKGRQEQQQADHKKIQVERYLLEPQKSIMDDIEEEEYVRLSKQNMRLRRIQKSQVKKEINNQHKKLDQKQRIIIDFERKEL